MNVVKQWFKRHFGNPQVMILAMVLVSGFLVIALMGKILAPVLSALILAYLLEGTVSRLERNRLPRIVGVLLVYLVFLAGLFLILFALLPMLSRQVAQLIQQVPLIVVKGQNLLMLLPERYPEVITEQQVEKVVTVAGEQILSLGQGLLSVSYEGLRSLFTMVVYLVLVPLLVFFFLKDKNEIVVWYTQFLPADRELTTQVWRDVDRQIGNYIRGKAWEILLVWLTTYVVFTWLGLDYTMLLSLFVGLSVLVPYIGATVMTIPIALIAFADFEMSRQFAYVMIAYGIIQLLDGNLLAPLLLSEVVNLHPVAIITAVLVFGGIWGFLGVFFAIPLATLVQAVLKAWPKLNTAGKSKAGGRGPPDGGGTVDPETVPAG